jgi:hypothetical protein
MNWWEDRKFRASLQKIKDPCWFFEHMLVLRFVKGKPMFFKLTKMQREILEHVRDELEAGRPIRVVLLKGRRIGYSTLMAGLLLWNTTVKMIEDGEDKSWDIVSASYQQATLLFETTRRMIEFNPLLHDAVQENKGGKRIYSDAVYFENSDKTLRSTVTALASGGSTKRGRSPDGIVWDEAAQVKDEDYNDLSISALSGDNHEFIGSTPYDDMGFFYEKATDLSQGYKIFYYPMAELTEEGDKLLEIGEHRKITPEMITYVHGCKKSGGHMSAQEVCDYLGTVDHLTARREVFGQFVAGSELYYPMSLIRKSMYDYLPMDVYKMDENDMNRELATYSEFRMGIDWAGAGKHKTCVSVFGFDSKTNTWHEIYWESWIRTRYNDQWERVKVLYGKFHGHNRQVRVLCDSTGTQDTNVDALQGLGVPAEAVNFSLSEKVNMGRTLYDLFQREQIRLGWSQDKFDELATVDAKMKGIDGHLGDWVAAIWCATKGLRTYATGRTNMYSDGKRKTARDAKRHFTVERGMFS